uniref:Uncharacterized protein n=1 Tax=Kalanchoe fedtschenkoi TaxID=63787 RepID=A0A7N0UH76_KALFE
MLFASIRWLCFYNMEDSFFFIYLLLKKHKCLKHLFCTSYMEGRCLCSRDRPKFTICHELTYLC